MEHQEVRKLIVDNDEFFPQVVALLEKGQRVTIPVKGYSMLPFIRGDRDLVELEAADPAGVQRDDIVLFHYQGRWILHRVLHVEGNMATIQGDGVWRGREVCPVDQIHGKVSRILKKGTLPMDPYAADMLRKIHAWQRLGWLRRYILALYRRIFRIQVG